MQYVEFTSCIAGIQVVVMKESAAHYITETKQHHSEKQILSSQQPVHLKMAGEAETCSVNNEKQQMNSNQLWTQTA
jgi:hypothetical protein